jgi:hypothetical protein
MVPFVYVELCLVYIDIDFGYMIQYNLSIA